MSRAWRTSCASESVKLPVAAKVRHTVGQILLLIHQSIAEDTLLDVEVCEVRRVAESQVGYRRVRPKSIFDRIGERCACYLTWAA